jgi:putative SOS response-associated peptidase YedK
MCGRYVSPEQAAIERHWNLIRGGGNPFARRYNVAPSTAVPVLHQSADGGALTLEHARWGLIPAWWKQDKLPTHSINARSEEAATKPMWRNPYRFARCLVPALGWYEWSQQEVADPDTGEIRARKQAHYLYVERDEPVGLAGLLAQWTSPSGEPVLSCAILTRAASASAGEVHDRMPVIIARSAEPDWLDPYLTDAGKVASLIRNSAIDAVRHYPVRPLVNSPRNEGPELIQPLDPDHG